MGTKRSRPEAQSSNNDHVHPDRKKARTHKNKPNKPRKPIDIDSLAAIKKRARAIERLLSRDTSNIPANKQNELERELAAHQQRIKDAQHKKQRSQMISKYHMVRFFGMLQSVLLTTIRILIFYLVIQNGRRQLESQKRLRGNWHKPPTPRRLLNSRSIFTRPKSTLITPFTIPSWSLT